MFDESLFPFAKLHPNAGARLRSELDLLPDILKNSPFTTFGDANLHDQNMLSSNATNALPSSGDAVLDSGTNADENTADMHLHQRGFRCHPRGDNSDPKAAPPRTSDDQTDRPGVSAPGSAPSSPQPRDPTRNSVPSSGSSTPPCVLASPAAALSQPQTDPIEGESARALQPMKIESLGSSAAHDPVAPPVQRPST